MTIVVRAARPEDLPAILDIYNFVVVHSEANADYVPQTLSERTAWYNERTKAGFPVLVAEEAETVRIVGWSAYGPYHGRIGYRFTVENSVYVAENQRGKGVGKQLLTALITHAAANGFHSIIASIDSANIASIRLHAAFGFEPVGHMKEIVYKFDRWLDVVYMQRML